MTNDKSNMPEWKKEIAQRLSGLNLAPTREAEIVDELSQHLDDRYAELVAGGVTGEQAARMAVAELSESDVLARELQRVEKAVEIEPVVLGYGRKNVIADLWQDLRYSVRSLRKHAALSLVVIATLTFGVGVSAGIFTFYNAEFLRAKVDGDFDSYVQVYSAYSDPQRPGRPGGTTLEDYLAFRDRAKALRDVAAWADFRAPLGQDDPGEVRALLVTSNFFSLYGLEQPLLGRLLEPEDWSAAASPVVVLSDRLWRERFSADSRIIGRVTYFNGQSVTVVGVAPTFAGMVNNARAWFPYTLETYLKHGEDLLRPGEAAWLNVAGLLNSGFSRREAAAELDLIAGQQDQLHPARTTTLTVTDGSAIQIPGSGGQLISALVTILGVLVFFVLIVCLNVTTLLLSRAAGRRQEIAVRLALGAGRMRLVRMLLTETFLLAALAGVPSLFIAYRLPNVLMRWLTPSNNLDTWSLAPDWRAFVFLTFATLLAGTLAGLTPALQSLKVNPSEMLKGRQSMPGGAGGSRLYGLLIGAQVALSFFLLCGAGFSLRAYRQATTFEPGFETRQVLWTGLFPQRGNSENRNWENLQRALDARITALPGVESVAYSYRFPFMYALTLRVQAVGQAAREVAVNWVSPNYFDTMSIPILSGRAIRESDRPCGRAGCVVVVSRQLARDVWPNENPLGRTLRDREGHSFEVVGVARDVSSTRLGRLDDPMIYQPLDLNNNYPPQPFVRFSGDGATLARAITAAARELAPALEVDVRTIQSRREELMEGLGRDTGFITIVCAIAVVLAVIGIYGVVAFAVSRRTKEMGIRIALGARKENIYSAVLKASGRPVAVGLMIGLALTITAFTVLSPVFQNAEVAVNLRDPIIYAATAILLAAVAMTAMLAPARKATRVDPMDVLRFE